MKIMFMAIGYPPPLDRRELELPDGTSLNGLLNQLSGEYGVAGLAGILALNERIVERLETTALVLKDGDQIILAPPLSGG